MGITSERDGTLAFDEEKFESAIQNDPNSVKAILENLGENLAATNGVIDQFTRFNGLIDNSITESKDQITSMQNKISDTEKQLSKQEESLTNRFAKLEALISKMQSQQSHLSSILGSL